MSVQLLTALVRGLEVREELDCEARRAAAKRAAERFIERLHAEWGRIINDPLYRLHAQVEGRPDFAMEPGSEAALAARDAYVERRMAFVPGLRAAGGAA